MGEQGFATSSEVVTAGRARGEAHRRGEHVLTRSGETDLSRLLAVKGCRGGRDRADQVVGQERGPEFSADHFRRLAANVVQAQGLLDRANIEFRVPAEVNS